MTKKGTLEIVCGSMFSGKTEELMRRLKRAEYAKQKALTIKHHIDNRKSVSCIVSHDGNQRQAHALDGSKEGFEEILAMIGDDTEIVGVDEAQFFPEQIVDLVQILVASGKRVIAAGLDMNFRGEPFGVMPALMAMADDVTKLKAICMKCGADAHYTQRLIDGEPAKWDDPIIVVGAEECYEARCRECYAIDMPLSLNAAVACAHA